RVSSTRPLGRNPGSVEFIRAKLRTSSPASTRRTTDSAISSTTTADGTRVLAVVRPAPHTLLVAPTKRLEVAYHAGTSPQRMLVTAASPTPYATARTSNWMASNWGSA